MDKRLIKVMVQATHGEFSLAVDLSVPGQGVTALFGRSGSGKTTLLRCIAGLIRPAWGEVRINGEVWQSDNFFLPVHRRSLGYVFQEASLFSHLSVEENLRYATTRARKLERVVSDADAIELLGIGKMLKRMPDQLSGGERQRVAIARALLAAPKLLLMDEPLASLDQESKQEIMPYLEDLRDQLQLAIIYVSHAMEEVSRLADHIVVMDAGGVLVEGGVSETLSRTDFPVGQGDQPGVLLQGEVVEHDPQWHLRRVDFGSGSLWLTEGRHLPGERVRVRVLARDVSLALNQHRDTSILNSFEGLVADIAEEPRTGSALARVAIGESYLLSQLTMRSVAHLKLKVGSAVWVQVKSVALVE